MKLILSTGSLHTYGTARAFELAARAGFDGVELMIDYRWDTRQPEYVQSLIDQYQLPVLAVHSPFQTVPGWPTDHPDLIAASVQLAEALAAPVVVHHLPEAFAHMHISVWSRRWLLSLPGWDRHRAYRSWLSGPYALFQSHTPVKLCIENMPARQVGGRRFSAYTWNQNDEILRFPFLTLDTTHLATWNHDPTQTYERWRNHVQHIHLSNYDGRQHRRPEMGHLDLEAFLHALVWCGYSGAVSLELHPDAVEAGTHDSAVIEMLHTSLEACRRWIATAHAESCLPASIATHTHAR